MDYHRAAMYHPPNLRPPLRNPFEKFNGNQFDSWVGQVTANIRNALRPPIAPPDFGNKSQEDVENTEDVDPISIDVDDVDDQVEVEEELVLSGIDKGKGRAADEGPGVEALRLNPEYTQDYSAEFVSDDEEDNSLVPQADPEEDVYARMEELEGSDGDDSQHSEDIYDNDDPQPPPTQIYQTDEDGAIVIDSDSDSDEEDQSLPTHPTQSRISPTEPSSDADGVDADDELEQVQEEVDDVDPDTYSNDSPTQSARISPDWADENMGELADESQEIQDDPAVDHDVIDITDDFSAPPYETHTQAVLPHAQHLPGQTSTQHLPVNDEALLMAIQALNDIAAETQIPPYTTSIPQPVSLEDVDDTFDMFALGQTESPSISSTAFSFSMPSGDSLFLSGSNVSFSNSSASHIDSHPLPLYDYSSTLLEETTQQTQLHYSSLSFPPAMASTATPDQNQQFETQSQIYETHFSVDQGREDEEIQEIDGPLSSNSFPNPSPPAFEPSGGPYNDGPDPEEEEAENAPHLPMVVDIIQVSHQGSPEPSSTPVIPGDEEVEHPVPQTTATNAEDMSTLLPEASENPVGDDVDFVLDASPSSDTTELAENRKPVHETEDQDPFQFMGNDSFTAPGEALVPPDEEDQLADSSDAENSEPVESTLEVIQDVEDTFSEPSPELETQVDEIISDQKENSLPDETTAEPLPHVGGDRSSSSPLLEESFSEDKAEWDVLYDVDGVIIPNMMEYDLSLLPDSPRQSVLPEPMLHHTEQKEASELETNSLSTQGDKIVFSKSAPSSPRTVTFSLDVPLEDENQQAQSDLTATPIALSSKEQLDAGPTPPSSTQSLPRDLSPLLHSPLPLTRPNLYRHHHGPSAPAILRTAPGGPLFTNSLHDSGAQHAPELSRQDRTSPSAGSSSKGETNPNAPVTRSNCRFHKISIPYLPTEDEQENADDEDAETDTISQKLPAYFIVPGCALSRRDVMQLEQIKDLGEATKRENETKVADFTLVEPEILSVLRSLVGPEMLHEDQCAYLPTKEQLEEIKSRPKHTPSPFKPSSKPSSSSRPRKRKSRNSTAGPSSKGHSRSNSKGSNGVADGDETDASLGSTQSHASSATTTQTRTRRRRTITDISYQPQSEEEDDSGSDKQTKKRRRKSRKSMAGPSTQENGDLPATTKPQSRQSSVSGKPKRSYKDDDSDVDMEDGDAASSPKKRVRSELSPDAADLHNSQTAPSRLRGSMQPSGAIVEVLLDAPTHQNRSNGS